MRQVEFEPMIPVFERASTVHVLDRMATVIGSVILLSGNCSKSVKPSGVC
jgi:hypothetical protein